MINLMSLHKKKINHKTISFWHGKTQKTKYKTKKKRTNKQTFLKIYRCSIGDRLERERRVWEEWERRTRESLRKARWERWWDGEEKNFFLPFKQNIGLAGIIQKQKCCHVTLNDKLLINLVMFLMNGDQLRKLEDQNEIYHIVWGSN